MDKVTRVLLAIVVVLAATACSSSEPDGAEESGDGTSASPAAGGGQGSSTSTADEQFVDGGTFSMRLAADPGNLDPATAVVGATNTVLSFAYDTLIHQTPDGELVPGLADDWEVTPESVTFQLRDDATCADGSAVTPDVVARSVNHVVDPETGSPLVGVLVPAGLTATADGEAGTVTFTTEEPNSFLLHSAIVMFVVCGEGLDDRELLASGTSGSGPYVLEEAVPNERYTFRVRDDYTWGADGATTDQPGIPETVVLRVIPEESTAANLLLTGELNAAQITGADRERLAGSPDAATTLLRAGNIDLFFHQADDRPTSDPLVREALARAVDLDELANIATSGTGNETTGLIALEPDPCAADSASGNLPTFDTEAAADALQEAGWVPGDDGIRRRDGQPLEIRLLFMTDSGPGQQPAAEYLAEKWGEIGVSVELRGEVSASYGESLFTTGDWDASLVPLGLGLPSQLVGYVSGSVAPDGSNFAHIDNPSYTGLAAEASAMTAEEGCDAWVEAEAELFRAIDVVPIAESTQLLASVDSRVDVVGGLVDATSIRLLRR